jgi:hypothetical protein
MYVSVGNKPRIQVNKLCIKYQLQVKVKKKKTTENTLSLKQILTTVKWKNLVIKLKIAVVLDGVLSSYPVNVSGDLVDV